MLEYRTVARPGTRLPALVVLGMLLGVAAGQAQMTATLQDGALSGLVRDAETGQPVPFALILLPQRDLRVFASAAGRFTLAGLGPGEHTVEVRQIGYTPVSFRIRAVRGEGQDAVPPLVLEVVRQPLRLPTVSVAGQECRNPRERPTDPAVRAILDQLVTNAERLLAMERSFPVRARFERAVMGLGAGDSVVTIRWDTLETHSDHIQGYRHGQVMRTVRSRTGANEQIRYFTTSDIARREFRDRHCLAVVGEETHDEERLLRIDFAPVTRDRAIDWAGSLFLNARTGLLRRSEAELVKIPLNAPRVRGSRCEASYTEIVPTLVHESGINCYTTHEGWRTRAVREVWGLLEWRFTGRVPGG